MLNDSVAGYVMPATDLDFDEVQATFDTNVLGVMRVCKEFAPLFIKAQGKIVMIRSVAALMPFCWGGKWTTLQ